MAPKPPGLRPRPGGAGARLYLRLYLLRVYGCPARYAASSIRTATSIASIMLSGFAMPCHARSKAVP